MIDDKKDHSDELYTITLFDRSETGEKVPERTNSTEKIINSKQSEINNTSKNKPQDVITPIDNRPRDIVIPSDNRPRDVVTPSANRPRDVVIPSDNKQQELVIPLTKAQRRQDFINRHGQAPMLNTSTLIAKQAYYTPPVQSPLSKKNFIEQALEYVDKTHEKTAHIPFMCYWPSYEYMSQAQLNWYFYMRNCIRNSEYVETDLSYLFVYIYELINQVGVSSPDDGLDKLLKVWINYRNTHNKLDRYLTDWIGDYISYYKCDAEKVIELLKQEGLFLLMPTDMLADYYFKNNLVMPIELISRFSDYKLYESEFIKGENGNLFTDNLTSLINDIRKRMNSLQEGSFEKRDLLLSCTRRLKKLPFQKAIFHNPENSRIDTYLPYEQHKPFRLFITAVIKEFENQLRILTKYKGRLRPDSLADEIKNICKKYAKDAFNGSKSKQKVEITIDRSKLLALIQDSDEVRKRLIEGNYEYDEEFKQDDAYTSREESYTRIEVPAYEDKTDNESKINNETLKHSDTEKQIETDKQIAAANNPHAANDSALAALISDSTQVSNISWSSDNSPTEYSGSFRAKLASLQQKILDYLLTRGASSTTDELSTAFPGVLVGVEIDKINDIALEHIGDLLISFENDRWTIIEDYIDEL